MTEKPRMWKCTETGLWKCLVDGILGKGTTRSYAWQQMKSKLQSLITKEK